MPGSFMVVAICFAAGSQANLIGSYSSTVPVRPHKGMACQHQNAFSHGVETLELAIPDS